MIYPKQPFVKRSGHTFGRLEKLHVRKNRNQAEKAQREQGNKTTWMQKITDYFKRNADRVMGSTTMEPCGPLLSTFYSNSLLFSDANLRCKIFDEEKRIIAAQIKP